MLRGMRPALLALLVMACGREAATRSDADVRDTGVRDTDVRDTDVRDTDVRDVTTDAPPSPSDASPVDRLCGCLLGAEGSYALTLDTTGALPDVLTELSGLVTSRFDDTIFWAHDDSGGAAALYAIGDDGTLRATLPLPVNNRDWEELARGPCDDADIERSCLYVGDVGDNDSVYPSVRVHRVREPDPREPMSDDLVVESMELTFPDGARDTEAFVVDDDGTLVFLTKRPPIGHFRVYTAHFVSDTTATLTFHDEIGLGSANRASMFTAADLLAGSAGSAADFGPRCQALLGRHYLGAFVTFASDLTRLDERMLHPVPVERERQGEAIGFTADGYRHVGEGSRSPIHRWRCASR